MNGERDKASESWWQFSVRELLLCTVILALMAGWWVDDEREQRVIRRNLQKVRQEYADEIKELQWKADRFDEFGAQSHYESLIDAEAND